MRRLSLSFILTFTLLFTSVAGLAPVRVVTAQTQVRTHIVDTLVDGSGTPRAGKVTFILTQAAASPGGLIPKGASVSAVLNSAGQFNVYLYPSASLSPQAYYQVWFTDGTSGGQVLLGIYDIPATSASAVTLAPYKVTDTALAAQYTFASKAAVDALTSGVATAVAQLTLNQLLSVARTSGSLQKWDGTNLVGSSIVEAGGALTLGSNTVINGTATINGAFTATGGISGIRNQDVPALSGKDVSASAITGGTVTNSTITNPAIIGGTSTGTASSNASITSASINNSTINNSSLTGTINGATRTFSGDTTVNGNTTFNGNAIFRGSTILDNSLTLKSPIINNPTFTGRITGISDSALPSTLDGKTLNSPAISGTVQGNVIVQGNVTANGKFIGDASLMTGFGNTGGSNNTGSTTIGAGSAGDPNAVIDLQTRGGARGLRVTGDGDLLATGPYQSNNRVSLFFNNRFSVDLFGARAVVGFDNFPAIQAAIDACALVQCGPVPVPPGRYEFSRTLDLKSNVQLVAPWRNAANFIKTTNDGYNVVISAEGRLEHKPPPLPVPYDNAVAGQVLSDSPCNALTTAINTTTEGAESVFTTTPADAARFNPGDTIALAGPLFHQCPPENPSGGNTDFSNFFFTTVTGRSTATGEIFLAERVRRSDVSQAVKVKEVRRNVGVENIDFRNGTSQQLGFVIKFTDGVTLKGLSFNGVTGNSAWNIVASRNVTVEDCDSDGASFFFHTTMDAIIKHNRLRHAGIGSEGGAENLLIEGNQLSDGGNIGMVTGSRRAMIIGNTLSGAGSTAITLSGFNGIDYGENHVVNNRISGRYGNGILINGGAERSGRNVIQGNIIQDVDYGIVTTAGAVGSFPASPSLIGQNLIRARVQNLFFYNRPGALEAGTLTTGISTTEVAAKNVQGTIRFNFGETTKTVTFATPETDANYNVFPGVAGIAGAVIPSGSNLNVNITNKTATGFTLNLTGVVNGSTAVDVSWLLVR